MMPVLVFAAVFLLLWGIYAVVLPPLWRALTVLAGKVAAWTLRRRRVQPFAERASRFRDYLPVVLILAIGVALTMFIGDAFLDVAELVHAKSTTLQGMDVKVHDWMVMNRSIGATAFFWTLSTIGGPVSLAILVAVIFTGLLIARRFSFASYLLITAGGGGLINLELKLYFARARPAVAEALRVAHGYSFPSGHAMGSAVTFGALSYLVFRSTSRWRWKAAVLALAGTLVAAVSLSRVYLGVHWFSDVGAGVTAGTVWVIVCTVAYETMRRIRKVRLRSMEAAAL
jgi:membrane-associated phospholipid phosphatase